MSHRPARDLNERRIGGEEYGRAVRREVREIIRESPPPRSQPPRDEPRR